MLTVLFWCRECVILTLFLFYRTVHRFGLLDMAVACFNTAYYNIYAANGVRSANLSFIVFSVYL